MTMNGNSTDFSIHREAVARHTYYSVLLILIFPFGLMFGVGIVLALFWCLWLGRWLPQRQAEALRYWLDGSTLRVDGGVYFLQRKAIPLNRITDLILVQGPMMRWAGIWGLRVQTAGTGNGIPEAKLIGLREPEKVRDLLIQARNQVGYAKPDR
jgi:putative membrane protein